MTLSRGLLVVALAAGLLHLLGRVTDGGWLDLASAAVLALPVAALVLRPRLDQVTCTRGQGERGAAGDRVTTVLDVANSGARPSAALVVLDELPGHEPVRVPVPSLAAGGSVRLRTERTALRRTSGAAGTATLHAESPFGLVGTRRRLALAGRAVVHPAPVPLPVLPTGRGEPGGDGARGRPVAGSGTEVLGLRAWRPGEPRTSVSARASARHGRPLVLERERQDERDLVVLVTAGSGPAWERGLSAAAALGVDALRRGRPLVLLGLSAPSAPHSAAQVLDALAAADDAPPLTLAAARAALRAAGAGGTVVLVTPGSEELDAVRRAATGARTGLVVLGDEPVPAADPPADRVQAADPVGLPAAAAVAVVVTGLCGQAAAALAGVLPAAALAVSAVLLPLAAVAAVRSRWRTTTVSTVATVLAVLASAVAAPGLADGGSEGIRAVLGPLLVVVQVLQALTWRTKRDLQTALLVALGLLVLGGSYAPDVVVGLPLLAGWVAALVAGLLLRRWTGPEPGARPVVVATALAVALGVAAFLLVPVPDDRALRSRLTAAAQAVQPSGRSTVFTGDRMDLSTRGELSDTPLVEVAADSPTLWRSGVWSTWDGRAWTSPERRSTGVPGPPYVLPAAAGAPRTDRVRPLTADPTLWAPGQVSSLDSQAGRVTTDGLGSLRRSWSGPYRITTAVQELDGTRLRAAAGPGDPDPRWQQLPGALPDRVRDLARELTATAPSRYDAVLAVERWLAANATYRLDSPVPGPGEDAVDRFLFVDRTGFCEQFAAAEAVLLRAAGIPARVATGLAYGVPGDQGLRTYREKDLHAWVEVSYEGVGWVSSDPTAGAALAGAEGGLRARVGAQLSAVLRSAESVPGGRPAIAAALLATVVAAGVATRVRRRRPDTPSGPREVVPAGPALAAFLRLDSRLGERRRRPAESLAELRDRVGLPAGALSVVERECYGPEPPDARSAVEVLDRLERPARAPHGAQNAGTTSGT